MITLDAQRVIQNHFRGEACIGFGTVEAESRKVTRYPVCSFSTRVTGNLANRSSAAADGAAAA